MSITPSFTKSLIVEQFQGNYLKEFWANGISLRFETWIVLLDEKHLVDKTIKFSLTLKELAFFEEGCQRFRPRFKTSINMQF